MSTYAIGDVQGCYDELLRLLDKIRFDPAKDRLWFAGDLVNRGPDSLKTLRLVKSLDKQAVCVLGNHDFHLLAAAAGPKRCLKKSDTLRQVLDAPDAGELLSWLRHRKLMHSALGYSLVHAGIYPLWSIKKARKMASTVEKFLTGDNYRRLLKNMYGNVPAKWKENAGKIDKLRFIINAFTRMRFVKHDGSLEFLTKSNFRFQNMNLIPWFSYPERKVINKKILFGHWSTLGQRQFGNAYALDTGCVWKGRLTALEITKKIPLWHTVKCGGKN